MTRYRLMTPLGDVIVAIASEEGFGEITYDGDEEAAAFVRSWLEVQPGREGHIIGDRATPIDLEIAFAQDEARVFSPVKL